MEKSKVKDIWSIVHKATVTDYRIIMTTYVKAETAEKALSFFNKKIADNHLIQKAEIKNVKQLEAYEANQVEHTGRRNIKNIKNKACIQVVQLWLTVSKHKFIPPSCRACRLFNKCELFIKERKEGDK